jgi:hypothetical protein
VRAGALVQTLTEKQKGLFWVLWGSFWACGLAGTVENGYTGGRAGGRVDGRADGRAAGGRRADRQTSIGGRHYSVIVPTVQVGFRINI